METGMASGDWVRPMRRALRAAMRSGAGLEYSSTTAASTPPAAAASTIPTSLHYRPLPLILPMAMSPRWLSLCCLMGAWSAVVRIGKDGDIDR